MNDEAENWASGQVKGLKVRRKVLLKLFSYLCVAPEIQRNNKLALLLDTGRVL